MVVFWWQAPAWIVVLMLISVELEFVCENCQLLVALRTKRPYGQGQILQVLWTNRGFAVQSRIHRSSKTSKADTAAAEQPTGAGVTVQR
mmetsp:Transcript_69806/g.125803  ORF Transcript_69806/g.125803 Transcript_69806/m.125803 type:complete len:89 (+) Transcript_69806:106-372(+)